MTNSIAQTPGQSLRVELLCVFISHTHRHTSTRGVMCEEIDVLVYLCLQFSSVSSVAQSCPTLCDPMNRSRPGLLVHHQLLEFTQTHVHWVSDAIQPSHPLSSPSPPAPNPSQHQSLFQWVNSSHEVAKALVSYVCINHQWHFFFVSTFLLLNTLQSSNSSYVNTDSTQHACHRPLFPRIGYIFNWI